MDGGAFPGNVELCRASVSRASILSSLRGRRTHRRKRWPLQSQCLCLTRGDGQGLLVNICTRFYWPWLIKQGSFLLSRETTFPVRDRLWIFLLTHLQDAAGREAFPKCLRPVSTKGTFLQCENLRVHWHQASKERKLILFLSTQLKVRTSICLNTYIECKTQNNVYNYRHL